jgi:flavin-dependent dehydrogenase
MERFAITNPYGCAWHVNRTAFDGWLLDEAVIAGARNARPASVRGVRRGAAGWELRVAAPSGTTRYVTARVVVHAGGRCSTHADWFGATPRRYDALCAVIGRSAEEGDVTGGLVVEATPDGWWYSTMSDGGVITALVTDPDVLVASGRHGTAMRAALERAPLTRLRVRSLRDTIATVSACSAALDPASGDGWLAVGDAAIARDPLSGEGLLSAMRSAIAAAEAVEGHLRGDSLALVAYASQVRAWTRAYLVARRSVYAGQTRWSDRPFWRRRRASMDRRLKPMDGVYVDRQG